MTHEELLAELNELDDSCSVVGITVAALRAVVELHKPFTEREDGLIICNVACNDEGGYLESYPCKTIQAIEKEL